MKNIPALDQELTVYIYYMKIFSHNFFPTFFLRIKFVRLIHLISHQKEGCYKACSECQKSPMDSTQCFLGAKIPKIEWI